MVSDELLQIFASIDVKLTQRREYTVSQKSSHLLTVCNFVKS